MTDRELLELAAKAAGMDYLIWTPGAAPIVPAKHRADPERIAWHPLSNDGDALRLAVKLRIDLSLWINLGSVTAKTHIDAGRGISLVADNPRPVNDHTEPRGTDETAATRRAIVRAAAEIGARK